MTLVNRWARSAFVLLVIGTIGGAAHAEGLRVRNTASPKGVTFSFRAPVGVGRGAEQRTSRIAGVLVSTAAADAKPLPGLRVLLIAARALDLTGRNIERLPPRGTFVVDAPRDKPASVVRSDANGKFSFEDVADGRYVLGMLPTPEGAYVANDVRLLEGKRMNPAVIDLKGGQSVDVGRVNPPARP